jgi:hypothetical protein
VPRGGAAATVLRVAGDAPPPGAVLVLGGLPAGVEAEVPPFAEGTDAVPVVLRAPADAAPALALADVGLAGSDGNPLGTRFEHQVPLTRVDNDRVYVSADANRLPVAVCDPCPFALEVQAPRVPLAGGGTLALAIGVRRDDGFKAPVRVRAIWAPPGVSVQQVTAGEGAAEVSVRLDAEARAKPGRYPLVFVASAEIAGTVRECASPVLTLEVTEPWLAAELGRVRTARDARVELPVVLQRKRELADSLRAELSGLPADVRAEPVEVPSGAERFAVPVVVGAKAPPGRHAVVLRVAVVTAEGEVVHVFRGGELRIDRAAAEDEP